MLYREIIAVCSQIHTKHINTLCGQKVVFFNFRPGGTYSDLWNLEGWLFLKQILQPSDIWHQNNISEKLARFIFALVGQAVWMLNIAVNG